MGLFCALGLVGRLVLGFVGGLVFGSGRGLVFGSTWPEGSGGGGGWLSPCPCQHGPSDPGNLGRWGRGGDGHLVELGVFWVFHPDDHRFHPVDTGDGAHLHTRGVRNADFGADEGVVGTHTPPKGGCLGGRGGLRGRGGAGGGGGGVSCWGGGGDGFMRRVIEFKMPSGGFLVTSFGDWGFGGGFGRGGRGAPLSPLPYPPNHPPPSLPISPHPPAPYTPSTLTWSTPQPGTSLHPPTPPSRPSPAPNPSTPQDGQPHGRAGRDEAVEVPEWHLMGHIAVKPGQALGPRLLGVDDNIRHLQRDGQDNT